MELNQDIVDTLKVLRKQFGDESVMILTEETIKKVPTISSGSLKIDHILGGGYPQGRIIEIYGPESSGKTTLALHAVAEAQKKFPDKVCAYIDAEHAVDTYYAGNLGVDFNKLIFNQPDNGEQALEVCEALARTGQISLIVIDSVAALTPQAEIEGEMGDTHIGLLARLMSQAMRKLVAVAQKTNTTIVFINQIRMKIGVMYGNPETTPGGQALKFAASQRIEIRKGATANNTEESTTATVKVVKNKVAAPFKKTDVTIEFGKGLDPYSELADVASDLGVITKGGSWFSYNETKIGQGKPKVVEFLHDNEDLYNEIKQLTIEAIRNTD